MRVLLIDFYDSFTHNIAHYLEGLDADVDVVKDGDVDFDKVNNYDALVFSPGPGLPKEKKQLFQLLEKFSNTKKILGVCLGMQGIAEFFGSSLINQENVKHGITDRIKTVDDSPLFNSLPQEFNVGLYHSWAVNPDRNENFKLIAETKENVVMAIQHKSLPIFGVQFHPESIMSEHGKEILSNFLFKC